MEYRANFNAQGTHLKESIVDTNKVKLLHDIREIAKEHWHKGHRVNFSILDENNREVYVGVIRSNGTFYYFVYNYKRKY